MVTDRSATPIDDSVAATGSMLVMPCVETSAIASISLIRLPADAARTVTWIVQIAPAVIVLPATDTVVPPAGAVTVAFGPQPVPLQVAPGVVWITIPAGRASDSETPVSATAPDWLLRTRTRIVDVPFSATIAGSNDLASETMPVTRETLALTAALVTPCAVVSRPAAIWFVAVPDVSGVVTLTAIVQFVAPAPSVPPLIETLFDPGVAVTVPVQLVTRFGLVLEITWPAGCTSVSEIALNGTAPLAWEIVRVRRESVPASTVVGRYAFARPSAAPTLIGAEIGEVLVTGFPLSVPVIPPAAIVLVRVPVAAVGPMFTGKVIVQVLPPGMDAAGERQRGRAGRVERRRAAGGVRRRRLLVAEGVPGAHRRRGGPSARGS